MITAEIKRKYNRKNTLGSMIVRNPEGQILLQLKTLELPWRNNEYQVSCIPEGEYHVIPRTSPKYGPHYHILHVPDRSFILFHVANYVRQLQGCIAPGLLHSDIDRDGLIDVASSRAALNKLLRIAPEGFTLKIGST